MTSALMKHEARGGAEPLWRAEAAEGGEEALGGSSRCSRWKGSVEEASVEAGGQEA